VSRYQGENGGREKGEARPDLKTELAQNSLPSVNELMNQSPQNHQRNLAKGRTEEKSLSIESARAVERMGLI
jgi:hypothetical protein